MTTQTETKPRTFGPWPGAAVFLFSLLGILASVMLLQSELDLLRNPDADLLCDVNPLVGCSSSLLTPQAHLLGIPNSAVGLLAFGALAALGVVLALDGRLPKLVWWGLVAGALGALAFVVYFVFESVTTFKALCPYCMLTWVAALAVIPLLLGGAATSGALGEPAKPVGRSIVRYSWAITLVSYLLIVLVVVLTMSDKLARAF